jgi:RimJ/RimL family protein N-acetyltransferase
MLVAMPAPLLESPRLLMRPFTAADARPYAAIITDPEVMSHMGAGRRYRAKRALANALAKVSPAEARWDLRRIQRQWERLGWGEWAVEERETGALIGRVGFKHHPDFSADASKVEIGWLLAREAWGRGYATEAATMALDEGMARLGLDRVISICIPSNRRSLSVMQKLGMSEAGRTRWKGLDVIWTVTDRSAWTAAAGDRTASAR